MAPPPTASAAEVHNPTPALPADTRLPPERWQEWPIMPQTPGRALQIYQAGLARGNNPRAFSKVGDCQNVQNAFMGFFDNPHRYNLGTDYQYLQEAIDYFAGNFATDGQAVKGGFNAATALSPLWANPEVCQAGESPLDCELRNTRPSIVIISFEVWWQGRTAESYEKYMRQVIDKVIASGAVPILATKADNVEGDHSINLTTVRLAYEYAIPLWNFWLAVQSLPNYGLDPVRNDGFHISVDGWNTRSFTGLQALDSVWRAVRGSGLTSNAAPLPVAHTESLAAQPSILQPGLSLAEYRGGIFLAVSVRQGGQYQSLGVYAYDPNIPSITRFLPAGYELQGASPDGDDLLVNQGQALYRMAGASLELLSDQFFHYGGRGALWLADGRIVFLLNQNDVTRLAILYPDSSEVDVLLTEATPISIYPASDGKTITWESGTCANALDCTPAGAWLTNLESRETRSMNDAQRPLISPRGQVIAFIDSREGSTDELAFAWMEDKPPRRHPLAGDMIMAMTWNPNGDWLAVNTAKRSNYSGRLMESNNFLVNSRAFTTRAADSLVLLNPRWLWAPDGANVLILGSEWRENAWAIHAQSIRAASAKTIDLGLIPGLASRDYIFISHAVWLPTE
jgi:hypothetical protein